jgi:hypothetical protein
MEGHRGSERGRRAVRGADTDSGGRRTGPIDLEDHEEGIEKEILPAYDGSSKSGPPRYLDIMMSASFASGNTGRGIRVETMEMNNLGGVQTTRAVPVDEHRQSADRPLGDPFSDEQRLAASSAPPSPATTNHENENENENDMAAPREQTTTRTDSPEVLSISFYT